MTIFEIHADVNRLATALERIVVLLERLVYPPPPAEVKVHQATLADLHIVTPADVAQMQEEKKEFSARYGVMPDSEAMIAVLQKEWEKEHANTKINWPEIYARAGGEPGGPSAPDDGN